MSLQRYGIAASAAVASVGTAVVAPASPAGAHSPQVQSLANVGHVQVLHSNGSHAIAEVCAYNNVHSARGEFKAKARAPQLTKKGDGCITGFYSYELLAFRACDPRGCTAWKEL